MSLDDFWIKAVGVLMVIGAAATALWRSTKARKGATAANFIYGIVIAAGIALILIDRIAKVSFLKIAEVEANVKQISTDATEVKGLRDTVKDQAAQVQTMGKEIKDLRGESIKMAEESKGLAASLQRQIDESKLRNEFQRVYILAQAEGRLAYDQLLTWAKDDKYPLQLEAASGWKAIMDSHEGMMFAAEPVSWIENKDTMGLVELGGIYAAEQSAAKRASILTYIWQQKRFPYKERVKFLAEVLEKEPNLTVVVHAANFFKTVSKENWKRLYIEAHLKWWEAHKEDPFPEPAPG